MTVRTQSHVIFRFALLRYVICFLCFSITAQVTYAQQCNNHDDYSALYQLYHDTDGDNWNSSTNWEITAHPDTVNVSSIDMSNWYGIICQSGRVTEAKLNSNGLNGSIPAEIGMLSQLTNLWLDNNSSLIGALPAEVVNLSNLVNMRLHFCQLSGTIPSFIGNLSNLSVLTLNGNDFSGTIPSSIWDLTNLTTLRLTGNELTGSIPSNIGSLTELTTLALDYNQLTGSIPGDIGLLSKLTSLNLGGNNITDSIPNEIGFLSKLTYLRLENNNFNGSIPLNIANLTLLTYLDLSNNQLSGSIPNTIKNLPQLQRLYLNGNQLSGSIPYNIGDLSMLSYLFLNDNLLTGCYPSSLSNLCNIPSLDLSGNPGLPGGGDMQGTLCTDGTGECCIDVPDTQDPQPICVPQLNISLAGDGTGILTNSRYFYFLNQDIDDCTSDGDLNIQISIYRDGIPDTAFTSGPLSLDCDDICRAVNVLVKVSDLAGNSTICNIPIVVEDKIFPSACSDKSDYSTLVFLYKEVFNGPNWTNKSGWEDGADGTNCDPCTWHGVTCNDSGRVIGLNLYDNNLNGVLPPFLTNLNKLEALNLSKNEISGLIPSSYGSFESLKNLSIGRTNISGTIPTELWNLDELESLWLPDNDLSGTIPLEIENLAKLEFLGLEKNNFSGQLPDELSKLTNLRTLYLDNNNFEGTILDKVVGMEEISILHLQFNNFSGSFPMNFGNSKKMTNIELNNNNFTGPIPEALGYNIKLIQLDLSNNGFSGCIPYSFKTICSNSTISDYEIFKFDNNPGMDNGGNFNDYCNKEIGSCPPSTNCNVIQLRLMLEANNDFLIFKFNSLEEESNEAGVTTDNPNGDTLDFVLSLDTAWHSFEISNLFGSGLGNGSFEIRRLSSDTIIVGGVPFDKSFLSQEFQICEAPEFNNTYYVTNIANEGTGSLHEALSLSNSQYGHDTIIVQTTGVIEAGASTLIPVLPRFQDVTIHGNGIILDGENQVGLSETSGSVYINDLTFRNGESTIAAGGLVIRNQAAGDTVILNKVLFEKNKSETTISDGGGAIKITSGSVVKAINSTFSRNRSQSNGGAVSIDDGVFIIENCTFTHNRTQGVGGAIYNDNGQLFISNSIIANSLPEGIEDIYNESTGAFHSSKPQLKSGETSASFPLNDNNLVENPCEEDCPDFAIEGVDPMLDTILRDNGGGTFTHALLPGSPALNQNPDSNPMPDARGFVSSTVRDIGSYEFMGSYTKPCEEYEFLIDTIKMQITTYDASEIIGSQQFLKDNSQIIYRASNYIELKKEFSILTGSTLEAIIEDCLD